MVGMVGMVDMVDMVDIVDGGCGIVRSSSFSLPLAVRPSLAGACSSSFSLLYVPQALACQHATQTSACRTYLACTSM